MQEGYLAEAETFLKQALALNQDIGDRTETARNLLRLGNLEAARGDRAGAYRLYSEALQHMHALNLPEGIAQALAAVEELNNEKLNN